MEDQKTEEILEIVRFLKDHAMTKEEGVTKAEFNKEINHIKNQMVTKEYLDNKLSDLRGDLVVMMRKEDTKLKTLIEILLSRKVVTEEDAKKVFALEPFPSASL